MAGFEELARWRPRIERELGRQFAAERRAAPAFDPWIAQLEEFTLRGGKRFRALLVLAGFQIASHRTPAPALPAAAAMEQFQSWMLIHDDIMDHANTRRGGATVHRLMEARHAEGRWAGRREDFGIGMGITLGDLEVPYALGALLAVRGRPERSLAALREFLRMTRDTAHGQLLDIVNGVRPVGEVREKDVLAVHRLKTSVYTVAAPLRIGAILGGGSAALLRDLDQIGTNLGIAFQLRDDVLGCGLGGGPEEKSANDLREGKRTLLVVKAWEASDPVGRAEILEVLGQPDSSDAALARVRERIRSSGSLEYSEARISDLARAAFRRVERSTAFRPADRALLREVGERLVHRST